MDATKEKVLQDIQKEAGLMLDNVKVLDYIPDGLGAEYLFAYYDHITILIPYDQDKANLIDSRLLAWGWQHKEEGEDSQGYHIHYTHPLVPNRGIKDFALRLAMDIGMKGSTCRRVQIGVTEIPVFEVQCVDQAE